MSKTQLKVLWVGIGMLILIGLFPPGSSGGYNFLLCAKSVGLTRLLIEWSIVIFIISGLIITLKTKPDLFSRFTVSFWIIFYVSLLILFFAIRILDEPHYIRTMDKLPGW